MKAAIVTGVGRTPIYGEVELPVAAEGQTMVSVRAAALSNLTRSRASGAHYSASRVFPSIAGTDGVGVTEDGRRVYFAMPEPPNGSMAEFSPVHPRRCVAVPDSVDDVTAAAIANPGMSAWAGLVERGRLVKGETVLVNGATGTAGRIAVQLAKYLGAARVIAAGRNAAELDEVKRLGADVALPFAMDAADGPAAFEAALKQTFADGIDVVLDYLWGRSALSILSALGESIDDRTVRFVHVGAASGETSLDLPGALLRSSAIELMGSGVGSVSRSGLLQSIAHVFDAFVPAELQVETRVVPLADVEQVWESAEGKPRVVFTLR